MQVRSEFLQFGYDPCSEQKYNNTSWTGGNFGRRRKKRATVSAVADNLTIRCPSGTVYEETEEVCYGLGVVPAAGYDGLGDACSTLEGDSFEITSDEQLTGLINLIQTGLFFHHGTKTFALVNRLSTCVCVRSRPIA